MIRITTRPSMAPWPSLAQWLSSRSYGSKAARRHLIRVQSRGAPNPSKKSSTSRIYRWGVHHIGPRSGAALLVLPCLRSRVRCRSQVRSPLTFHQVLLSHPWAAQRTQVVEMQVFLALAAYGAHQISTPLLHGDRHLPPSSMERRESCRSPRRPRGRLQKPAGRRLELPCHGLPDFLLWVATQAGQQPVIQVYLWVACHLGVPVHQVQGLRQRRPRLNLQILQLRLRRRRCLLKRPLPSLWRRRRPLRTSSGARCPSPKRISSRCRRSCARSLRLRN
mmetsp:Transcript_44601/g.83077  ORF Transcript_44601/g.83077 Transcript_44601/m.83077 type:complete len:277 (-) Transcript_44601:567-1397(-)